MWKAAGCALVLAASLGVAGAEPRTDAPFEVDGSFSTSSAIDARVLAGLRRHGLMPARPCSDAVFVRRVYLDLIGTLPEPEDVRAFLQDRRSDKRATLIDALLQRDEFADFWALKWCDVLRVKAEFPINLWPNAAQAYHRWVLEAVRENRPYDRFAYELLTASGSNFRVPAVNFYRAVQGRDPAALAGAVALTFMGARIEHWPAERRAGLAAFFSRISYRKTAEWKEEIVCPNPAPTNALPAVFPDGKPVRIAGDEDPRRVFADWLLAPGNPWFAQAIANRTWAWFFGRGVVHEADDIRPDNPPSNPELLACLAREVAGAGYDLRKFFRLILNSSTYQQSPIPAAESPQAEALFGCYPVRRLEAEVLIDALCWLGGEGEEYTSAIPEPFTFIPADQRSITLADGSVTSPFLEAFGRPARDTGMLSERNNRPTDAQRLHLLNSTHVQRKLERSPRLRQLIQSSKGDRRELIRGVYLTVLSRYPEGGELGTAERYFQSMGTNPQQGVQDLAWALVNSKEFLYHH
jgi:hypothetical protein